MNAGAALTASTVMVNDCVAEAPAASVTRSVTELEPTFAAVGVPDNVAVPADAFTPLSANHGGKLPCAATVRVSPASGSLVVIEYE